MKRGLSSDTLKSIAIICMVCDHLQFLNANALFDVAGSGTIYYGFPIYILHAIGRVTAPVFFYMVVIGYHRTSNANRYAVRLFIFACISYIPAIWYFHGAFPNKANFLNFNVLFTMFLGLMTLRVLHEVRFLPLKLLCLALCLACFRFTEFGFFAAGLILAFEITRNHKSLLALMAGLVTLIYILYAFGIWDVVFAQGVTTALNALTGYVADPFRRNVLVVYAALFVPLILILLCRDTGAERSTRYAQHRRGAFNKWFFYVFYPAHIGVLLLVRLFIV